MRSGEFLGTDRFLLRRKIGTGGMGAVYEVYDRTRGDTVALKSLLWADPFAIYRLKEEFRALAGVAHANLVTLYELISDGEEWFFTMEMVDGVDFMRYVRPDTGDGTSPLDMGRLRAALPQLAEGVHHLHEAGKLHRDLKPPNVLVTRDHRVVILDFGIASDRQRGQSRQTKEEGIAGTALYMAPEQIDGESGTESDWYAVGTMLYEALTGRLPFSGSPIRVLVDKKDREAESPAAILPDLPPDLVGLCVELLAKDPARRPAGENVLTRLGVRDDAPQSMGRDDADAMPLVGREESLSRLSRSLEEVKAGAPVACYVYGPSGIGKSALVQHFLDRSAADGCLVLSGRCYERESVPYKALDGVVDSLTRTLRNLSRPDLEALVPPDAALLARVFPVLSRVDVIAGSPLPDVEIPDPREVRRRAFGALRELLVRLARRQPLVLYIDDLHWADADSVRLLDGLLLRPEAPNLLLVVCFRSEEIASNAALRDMLARVGTPGYAALPLGPLSESDSRALARALLVSLGGDAEAADGVAREAGGSPFLAEQLALYVTLPGAGQGRVGFREMLDARLEDLSPDARKLLHVMAVAGRPLASPVVRDAAGLAGDERPLIAVLSARHFIRATGSPARLEFYHDRLREGLNERLEPADAKRTHLVLAGVLERRGADPDVLFDHYSRAGETDRALEYAVKAAEKATAAFAFDQAVTYYERALALSDLAPLQRGLGDALASAGRGARAARTYLEAARRVEPGEALELRRRAAEQLLISGHLEEGLGVIRTVLASVGLKLAATPLRALISLLVNRVRIRIRGLGFAERPAESLAPGEITRIDTCWAVAAGLGLVDNIRAADFQTRHLLLALKAGEPHRIARALAIEAGFVATGGGPARERTGALLGRAQALSERIQSRYGLALSQMIAGVNWYYLGQWRSVYEATSVAARTLAEEFSGVPWELSTARLYQVYSLFFLGDYRQHGRLTREYLRDALDRGNLFAATIFRSGLGNVAWLVTDEVEEARRLAREAAESWPREEFRIPHYLTMLAEGQLALYSGEGARAQAIVLQAWRGFRRSQLTRIQNLRIGALHLRARGALEAARRDERALVSAEWDIALIERERMPWSNAVATLLRAALAARKGDAGRAVRLLVDAEQQLSACDMAMHASAARRRRGELVGGDEGRALIGLANAAMTERGVVNPEAMTRMLASGFGEG